jgi:tRNA(adenine34) deaminase
MEDERYMEMALEMARQALDAGEFPVGCVIAGADGVAATGRRERSRGRETNEIDHAEIVALRRLGIPMDRRAGLTVYSTMEPCLMCYAAIILNRVPRVVYAYEDVMGGGTSTPFDASAPLYREAGIEIVPGVGRGKSLELFARFFADPENGYWRGSLLAEYTIREARNHA